MPSYKIPRIQEFTNTNFTHWKILNTQIRKFINIINQKIFILSILIKNNIAHTNETFMGFLRMKFENYQEKKKMVIFYK